MSEAHTELTEIDTKLRKANNYDNKSASVSKKSIFLQYTFSLSFPS